MTRHAISSTSPSRLGLHCIQPSANAVAVVFLHGILSDGEAAWGTPSWPSLLASDSDLSGTGVFVFCYRTDPSSGAYSIGDAADNLREYFDLDDLWKAKQIILVGHSMGGVVARKFVLAQQAKFLTNRTGLGLFLIASPSLGSDVASTLAGMAQLLGHTQLFDLRASPQNTWLNDLDRDFTNLKDSPHLKIIGKELLEDQPMSFKRMLRFRSPVVSWFAAARYFPHPVKIPASDHLSISKPLSRDTLQYRILKNFLLEFSRRHYAPPPGPFDPHETARAAAAVQTLVPRIPEIATWPDARIAMQEALLETRSYIASQKAGGTRDLGTETRLSRMWTDVGNALAPHDSRLASLCVIKGQGWADPGLWNDPRFANLPVELDDMTHHLLERMIDRGELKEGLKAIERNLDRFEDIRLEGAPRDHSPTAVTHRLSSDGDAVEFRGYGEINRVSVADLAKLLPEDRDAIIASEAAMKKLTSDRNELVKKGRLSSEEEMDLVRVEGQIAEHLELILTIVEVALGGPLKDHYATQRAIAHRLRQRAKSQSNRPQLH